MVGWDDEWIDVVFFCYSIYKREGMEGDREQFLSWRIWCVFGFCGEWCAISGGESNNVGVWGHICNGWELCGEAAGDVIYFCCIGRRGRRTRGWVPLDCGK